MPNILVFAESREGDMRKVAFEAITAGRALADSLGGGEVHALLAGPPGIAAKAAHLGQYGTDVVFVCEHAGFARYARDSIAATLAEKARSGYRAVVIPFSANGRDLGPRIAVKLDGNGRYGYLDPFVGGQIAVAEAARNVVCVGARPVAVTDCLNFANPEKPTGFWQFRRSVEGL